MQRLVYATRRSQLALAQSRAFVAILEHELTCVKGFELDTMSHAHECG